MGVWVRHREHTEPAVDPQPRVKVPRWPPGWFLSSAPAENRWVPTTKALEHAAVPNLHRLLF